jgi:hypothetical protein
MSIATLILGDSGSGKSTSLRNLDPAKTLLIQALKKPLPFRAAAWKVRQDKASGGNIVQTDNAAQIEKIMRRSTHDVIVIDDFQATLTGEFMRRSQETGYQKYTDIGRSVFDICTAAGDLAAHRRVYIMAHTATDEAGHVRMKTVGKMVDQYVVPEGFFTIVLRTMRRDKAYYFSTQTNGFDCCKSPIGMLPDQYIENDLAAVDKAVCDFYGIEAQRAAA